jgi:hydrogenase maturation protein HypF
MELEWAAGDDEAPPYSFICHPATTPDAPVIVDWEPMIDELVAEIRTGAPASRMAARFHRTLAAIIGSTAELFGRERVALSGGCFQNRLLTESAIRELTARGFRPYWHQRVPPNDGGIALGQIVAAAKAMKRK